MKRSQAEIKMELKNSETQLENPGESLLYRMGQVEDKVSGLEGNRGIGPLQQRIWKTYNTYTCTCTRASNMEEQ